MGRAASADMGDGDRYFIVAADVFGWTRASGGESEWGQIVGRKRAEGGAHLCILCGCWTSLDHSPVHDEAGNRCQWMSRPIKWETQSRPIDIHFSHPANPRLFPVQTNQRPLYLLVLSICSRSSRRSQSVSVHDEEDARRARRARRPRCACDKMDQIGNFISEKASSRLVGCMERA